MAVAKALIVHQVKLALHYYSNQTKSLATALALFKVKVNAICPGLVEEGQVSAEERQMMAGQIPYGRPIRPDEIGKTDKWLVFDSPEAMTGSLVTVSGGGNIDLNRLSH